MKKNNSNNSYKTARKIKLTVVGDKIEKDRVYSYLRDAIYNQNKAYNILISNVYAAIYSGKSGEEIDEIYKRGQRKPKENDDNYSIYKYGEICFPIGMQTQASVCRKVRNDIRTAKNNGLFKGKISLPNRRLDAALMIESQQFSFYYDYKTYQELLDKLFSENVDIYMKFVNGIVFKLIFGNPKKSNELRCIFQKILEHDYHVCESSIELDGKDIILNLILDTPKQNVVLDEKVVVGVDMGQAIPAVCALNNNKYERAYIGSKDDFLRERTKRQNQRRRLQSSLKNSNGGHGRKKKLKPLDRFNEYESNFVKTYNHMVSKRVVDFALKHNAKYINLEYLKGYDTNKFILRNWSYYQLQTYIKEKAERYGIVVRWINPCYTSQVCSECGHWEENQRKTQSEFVCGNSCFNNGKKKNINADFNAARNISKSTLFLDRTNDYDTDELIKQGKEYYGII